VSVSPTTKKSPAKRVPPADRITDSACHGWGSFGRTPWPWIRSLSSASMDSPMLPAMPSRERRNDVSMMIRAIMKITATTNDVRAERLGTLGRARVSRTSW